ncbi:retropepsin-like aspartic protease [Sphingobacterium sp. HJSM2_6]|uniref:retropepsin-like aspartic protease n=1 Tax=Sphingobacterium sp. HJSM2_6 TaxID=3366264 RepID=UPI003BBE7349
MERSFLSKNKEELLPYLSTDFAIAGNTHLAALNFLDQLIQRYPVKTIKEINIANPSKQNHRMFEFELPNGTKINTVLELDYEGKIKYIHMFDALFGMNRVEKSYQIAKIPFENKNGSIILKVRINEYAKELNLLFDTGADGMAVVQDLADSINLKITRQNNASVVGGNQQIQVSDHNQVKLNELTLDDMSIAIFPNHEKDGTDGIIGNALFRRYITEIDFDNNAIILYTFGEFQYKAQAHILKSTFPNGVMEIPANLSVTAGTILSGNFVFDTGANYNLICFRPFVVKHKLLVSGFKSELQSNTVSLGTVTPTFTGIANHFQIAQLPPNKHIAITLMGATQQENSWNPETDGSIGIRTICRYNVIINLAQHQVAFTPNTLSQLPQDFICRNNIIGWNNQGQLILLQNFNTSQDQQHSNIITEFDGIKADLISKKPKLLEKIKQKAVKQNIQIVFENGSKSNI